MVVAAPLFMWIFILTFCVTLSDLSGSNPNLWVERFCGHGGLLSLFLFLVSAPLAILSLLALPFSLLSDWRKWKKNSLQK
jgi:hypothetical protein